MMYSRGRESHPREDVRRDPVRNEWAFERERAARDREYNEWASEKEDRRRDRERRRESRRKYSTDSSSSSRSRSHSSRSCVSERFIQDAPSSTILLRGVTDAMSEAEAVMYLGEAVLSMFYAKSAESRDEKTQRRWTCAKCNESNSARRSRCYDCGRSKNYRVEDSYAGREYVGSSPINTVVLRNLDPSTTENSIYQAVLPLCTPKDVKLVNCHVLRDPHTNTSKCIAFMETSSPQASKTLLEEVRKSTRIIIDSRPVAFDYSRTPFVTIMSTVRQQHQAIVAAANAIGAAAAIKSQFNAAVSSNNPAMQAAAISNAQSLSTPSVQAIANLQQTRYTYDSNSGYYHDQVSGYFYDPKSRYYFNQHTQQWLAYDEVSGRYNPVGGETTDEVKQPVIALETDSLKQPETETVAGDEESAKKQRLAEKRKARDVQRDMERWLKTQESAAKHEEPPPPQNDTPHEQHIAQQSPPAAAVSRGTVVLEFSDWSELICKLCQRKLTSVAALTKHNEQSALHHTNLEEYCVQRGLSVASVSTNSAPPPSRDEPQYRDRAKERRGGKDERKRLAAPPSPPRTSKVPTMPSFQAPPPALDDSNVGLKLAQKMGYQQGKGLGRNHQGIVDPIMAQQRQSGVGLGHKAPPPGNFVKSNGKYDYKSAAKASLFARFHENR